MEFFWMKGAASLEAASFPSPDAVILGSDVPQFAGA